MNCFKGKFKFILAGTSLFLFLILIAGIFRGETKRNDKKSEEVKSAQTKISDSPQSIDPSPSPILSQSLIFYDKQPAMVIKVVDGDTIAVSINGQNETIRMIGINTPETVDPRKTVECFGIEASNKAKEYFKNNDYKVWLEEDPAQGDRDKYQRLLRYVFSENGTQDYGFTMIKTGYAYEYTYSTQYKYQADYKDAQTYAQNNKLGLWADNICRDQSTSQVSGSSTSQVEGSKSVLGDRDCPDFKTQKEAQEFFIANGGPASDSHKLDSDKDGAACESLP